MNIFIISWFAVGLISMILFIIMDLRGAPYDENYFVNNILAIIYMPFMGYVSLIFLFYMYELEYQPLLKFIYKIANIGIEIHEDEEVEV